MLLFWMAFSIAMQRARVPWLDDEHARFWRGDAGQFADAHLRAVNFHHDIFHQRRGSLARCARR